MKRIAIFCLIPLFAIALLAAGTTTTVTTSTTFSKAGEIDTLPSATGSYSLKYWPTAAWQLAVFGTDSIKILMAFDGYVGGKWILGVKYDTLFLNETSAPTAARVTLLRHASSSTFAGYELMRARVTFGAVGADDSLSTLYYKAYLNLSD